MLTPEFVDIPHTANVEGECVVTLKNSGACFISVGGHARARITTTVTRSPRAPCLLLSFVVATLDVRDHEVISFFSNTLDDTEGQAHCCHRAQPSSLRNRRKTLAKLGLQDFYCLLVPTDCVRTIDRSNITTLYHRST